MPTMDGVRPGEELAKPKEPTWEEALNILRDKLTRSPYSSFVKDIKDTPHIEGIGPSVIIFASSDRVGGGAQRHQLEELQKFVDGAIATSQLNLITAINWTGLRDASEYNRTYTLAIQPKMTKNTEIEPVAVESTDQVPQSGNTEPEMAATEAAEVRDNTPVETQANQPAKVEAVGKHQPNSLEDLVKTFREVPTSVDMLALLSWLHTHQSDRVPQPESNVTWRDLISTVARVTRGDNRVELSQLTAAPIVKEVVLRYLDLEQVIATFPEPPTRDHMRLVLDWIKLHRSEQIPGKEAGRRWATMIDAMEAVSVGTNPNTLGINAFTSASGLRTIVSIYANSLGGNAPREVQPTGRPNTSDSDQKVGERPLSREVVRLWRLVDAATSIEELIRLFQEVKPQQEAISSDVNNAATAADYAARLTRLVTVWPGVRVDSRGVFGVGRKVKSREELLRQIDYYGNFTNEKGFREKVLKLLEKKFQ